MANEVHSDIAMRLAGDTYLSALFQKHANFESAIETMQNEYVTSRNQEGARERLITLQNAISSTFESMNDALSKAEFEFTSDIAASVGVFLTKFDAIFTLNQDLFIERHYHHPPQKILLLSSLRWQCGETPGIEDIPDPNFYGDDRPLRVKRRPRHPPFDTNQNSQPYFKLHGSIGWFAQSGEQMLVMGGNKHETMNRHPILKWYANKFLEYLSKPGAKLMVIGYGFRDQHINSILIEAWQRSHFPMFIVDPEGRNILQKVNPTYNRYYCPGPLEDIAPTYDSRRSLSRIFSGSDPGEHGKLMRFLGC